MSGSFEYWWGKDGQWVEKPNERRGGMSGVMFVKEDGETLYSKRQVDHVYRTLMRPFGYPTAYRENKAYRAFRQLGVAVPDVVFYGIRREGEHWQALFVTRPLDGYIALDSWYQSGQAEALGDEWQRAVMRQMASAIARMHRGRWQHGCLYAKHIFVKTGDSPEDTQIALLDLEKCRRRLSVQKASDNDIDKLKRHSIGMSDDIWAYFLQQYRHYLSGNA